MKIFKHAVAKVRNSKGEFEGMPALTGENIYQMAVRNGYIGTEDEYLAEIISDGWVTGLAEVKNDLSELTTSHDNLANEVVAVTPQILTGILPSDGWVENAGVFEYTLVLLDLAEDPTSIRVDADLSDITDVSNMAEINEAWGAILKCSVISEGNLYFAFSSCPTIDIPVKVEVING